MINRRHLLALPAALYAANAARAAAPASAAPKGLGNISGEKGGSNDTLDTAAGQGR